jgi:chloramphenicol 3-O-phosphotransferase
LNGASSAGKTWTALALRERLGPTWVCTGLDDILDRVQPFGSDSEPPLDQLRRIARIAWFQE